MDQALDTPERLYAKSLELGAGGTCFSLTYFLKDRMMQKGYKTSLLMGDKGRHRNLHCGLLFFWEGQKYLLDPGYMIYQPLLLPGAGLRLCHKLVPNQVCLQDKADVNCWRLFTGKCDKLKFRFDFRKDPVNEKEFMDYWRATFYFDMMEYPVLNMVKEQVQYYVQKGNLLTRTATGSEMKRLTQPEFYHIATGMFGIAPQVVEDSLGCILKGSKGLFLKEP